MLINGWAPPAFIMQASGTFFACKASGNILTAFDLVPDGGRAEPEPD